MRRTPRFHIIRICGARTDPPPARSVRRCAISCEVKLMFPSPAESPSTSGLRRIPIIMPQLGESIAEATIVRIACEVGEMVEGDQDVFEVETNKATMGVTTPCGGRVAELLV